MTLYITTPDDLPDWWKHGVGFCRGSTGLVTQFDFTGGPFNCVDFYGGSAARVQRREGDGDWHLLATVVPDGSRRVVYEDAAIVAGRSYSYRLSVPGPGGEMFLGEISIDVPAASTSLALSNVVLDSDGLTVSFSLTSTSPAKLDVYDVGGRRWITHVLSGLTAGEHRASVAGARRLESGVYFARLGQGKHQVTLRFLITR